MASPLTHAAALRLRWLTITTMGTATKRVASGTIKRAVIHSPSSKAPLFHPNAKRTHKPKPTPTADVHQSHMPLCNRLLGMSEN
jgi:hypothetical protein